MSMGVPSCHASSQRTDQGGGLVEHRCAREKAQHLNREKQQGQRQGDGEPYSHTRARGEAWGDEEAYQHRRPQQHGLLGVFRVMVAFRKDLGQACRHIALLSSPRDGVGGPKDENIVATMVRSNPQHVAKQQAARTRDQNAVTVSTKCANRRRNRAAMLDDIVLATQGTVVFVCNGYFSFAGKPPSPLIFPMFLLPPPHHPIV